MLPQTLLFSFPVPSHPRSLPPQYCGSSLARVGLDFQALLHPLFEAATLQLFAGHLAGAVEAFNTRLEGHKWVALPAPTMLKARQQEQSRAAAAAAAAASASDGGAMTLSSEGGAPAGLSREGSFAAASVPSQVAEDLSPPYVIMEHLPLAVLVNAVLSALNELRHCALLSLSRPAAGCVDDGCVL